MNDSAQNFGNIEYSCHLAANLPKRETVEHYHLANRLYDYLTERPCLKAEQTLATELNTTRSAIRTAKSLLERDGKIRVQLAQNGARSNPKHILEKVVTNQNSNPNILNRFLMPDWGLLRTRESSQLHSLNKVELVRFYFECRLCVIPLYHPQNINQKVVCSCRLSDRCSRAGKHPAIRKIRTLNFNSDKTQKYILKRFKQNPSLNVGFVIYGFVVIDVDFRHGGHYSFDELKNELGGLSHSMLVRTGNGIHIYCFTVSQLRTRTNAFSHLFISGKSGIDLRASGSIVVAPGSVHANGNLYEWQSTFPPEQLPDEWEKELANKHLEIEEIEIMENENQSAPSLEPERIATQLVKSGSLIHIGERNETLFWNGYGLKRRGYDQQQIFDEVCKVYDGQCEKGDKPLTVAELSTIARSAWTWLPTWIYTKKTKTKQELERHE